MASKTEVSISSTITRKASDQIAFGQPAALPVNVLPTQLDVARCFLYEKQQLMIEHNVSKEPDNKLIADIVVQKIQRVYERSSIPTVRKDKIKERVLALYAKRLNLQKYSSERRFKNPKKPNAEEFTDFFTKKKEEFMNSIAGLFEVADNSKVPQIEKIFLEDQRSSRLMVISGSIDKETTRKIMQYKNKKISEEARLAREKMRVEEMRFATITSLPCVEDDHEEESFEIETLAATTESDKSDSDFMQLPSTTKSCAIVTIPLMKRGRVIGEIAEAKVRNSISDRATAAIVNATLRTHNIPEVIDKSKVRRATTDKFEEMEEAPTVFGGGIGYDGRKDLTLMQEVIDGKYYQSNKIEEHISIVSLPDGAYIGHVTPTDGKARTIANTLMRFLQDKDIVNQIEVLACDGTNANVGAEGGINHFIETDIGHALQWHVCLLHANELPLRHLIIDLDGPTSGVNTFSGPLGKILPNVLKLSIIGYKRFSRSQPLEEIPAVIWKDLSTDQKYLWRIVSALISGKFDRDLERLTIGPCSHSRWLTTACRICRLYACTENASKVLIILTAYIVNVYAPMWFLVKHHELATDGPANLFFLMKRSEQIEDKQATEIVQRCIQRNAFFAHPENILLAQLASTLKSDRIDAVNTIVQARGHHLAPADSAVRLFRVPALDFKAKKWQVMIKWNETDIHEPPLVRKLTSAELLAIVATPLVVPEFKCHTQMVERAVKEVTRVSQKVIGEKRRNATIKASIKNRAKFPKQESRKDFEAV